MKRLFVSVIALMAFCLSFAQTNWELAQEALDNDQYSLAVYYANEYVNANPKDADGYGLRSLAYACNEEYREAFADVDKAIKLWNKKKSAYTLAGLYGLRARIHEQVQEYDQALADYALAIKKDKKNPRAYAQRGRYYYRQHEYLSAAVDYEKAHEMEPDNTEFTLELARNLWLMDLNKEAAKLLDELILYHPRLTEARRIRARIYFEAEDYTSFIDAYAEYLSLERDNEDFFISAAPKAYGYTLKTVSSYIKNAEDEDARYFWLGVRARVYLEMDQYKEALVDANAMQAIVSDTVKNGYILLLKSDSYEGLYDYASAARCYDDLIELYPQTDYTYYYYNHRARCYSELGEYEKAEADFQTVIENDMDYAVSAYAGRGHMKEEQRNYDGAIEDYSKALMIDEELPYILVIRGRVYLKHKNDAEAAFRDFSKALELEGENVSSTRVYALLYMGNKDDALALALQIVDEDPSASHYYDLACVYSLLDRKQEALQALTTAMEKGFRGFRHIEVDQDLDNIREMQEFKELISTYKLK